MFLSTLCITLYTFAVIVTLHTHKASCLQIRAVHGGNNTQEDYSQCYY